MQIHTHLFVTWSVWRSYCTSPVPESPVFLCTCSQKRAMEDSPVRLPGTGSIPCRSELGMKTSSINEVPAEPANVSDNGGKFFCFFLSHLKLNLKGFMIIMTNWKSIKKLCSQLTSNSIYCKSLALIAEEIAFSTSDL